MASAVARIVGKMKEESHRASEACEKSVDKTTYRTKPRRLDGHSRIAQSVPHVHGYPKPIIATFGMSGGDDFAE
jgi:hypothetical protein